MLIRWIRRGEMLMADEIMEAIQMLRFGYDGIKLGLDVTGSSIREAKI